MHPYSSRDRMRHLDDGFTQLAIADLILALVSLWLGGELGEVTRVSIRTTTPVRPRIA